MQRLNYGKAALVMWNLAQRVAHLPGASTVPALKMRGDALAAASTALALVAPKQAYLIKRAVATRDGATAATPGSKRKRATARAGTTATGAGADAESVQCVSLAGLRAELVLVQAQLDIARGNLVSDARVVHDTAESAGWRHVPSDPAEVQNMLLVQGRFERAMTLARTYNTSGYDYRPGTKASVSGSCAVVPREDSDGDDADASDADGASGELELLPRAAAPSDDGAGAPRASTGTLPTPKTSAEQVVAAVARAAGLFQATEAGSALDPALDAMVLDDADDYVTEDDVGAAGAGVGARVHAGREFRDSHDRAALSRTDELEGSIGRGVGLQLGRGGGGRSAARARRAWASGSRPALRW